MPNSPLFFRDADASLVLVTSGGRKIYIEGKIKVRMNEHFGQISWSTDSVEEKIIYETEG